MRKHRVDTRKVRRSIRLVVPLVLLFIFGVLVFSPDTLRVPVAYASPDVASFYPSGYNLFGSTKYLSGSVTDLQSDNTAYMTFRSYVSASSTSAKTNAFIAYRDSTTSLNTPKERTWTGDTATWGSQSEMATSGGLVRFPRVAYCPIENRSFEKIVVTLSADGYLDAYVWDGTAWSVTNDIANVGTTVNVYRSFDIAYEKTSGEALLVYSFAPATDFRIGYKTWSFVSGWSGESTYVIASGTAQTAYWISMASKPTSGANEIAVGVLGDSTSLDAYGLIWNGASFSSQQLLTGTVTIATRECIAVAYEQSSGYATFVSSTSNDAFSWQWSGSAWDASATTFDLSGPSQVGWFTLKADPASGSDKLFCVSVDAASDLNSAEWSGAAWTLHTEHDTNVDAAAQRPADFAWESTGSKGLLVYGTSSGVINWKSYTYPNSFPSSGAPTMGANTHPWVQLRTNPRSITGDVKILGAILEDSAYDLGAISWDGTTFTVIGTNTISSDTTLITYECFDLKFQRFGPPSEFTSELEFTGTSNTQSWTQLVWTVDSSFTTTSVTTTLQLYNYITGQYSPSGDGYMTDTIGISDVTKNQTITTNPTYFRDASGNWKMKIKGVKSTSTQFDWKGDFVKYEVTWTVAMYALNLRVRDWDLTDNIQGAIVYKDSDTKTSDSNGWANWTAVSGTVQIKVKYYGFWVNGTFSVTMDSDKTIDVKCKLYDVTIKVQEAQHNAYLVSANVTVFNASSTSGNKIKSGVTGSTGQVSFTNLPNGTLVFTQYGGSSYSIVIGNATQAVYSENQSITLTSNQNYVSTSSPYSIFAFLGLIIPLKKCSQLDVSRENKMKKCKRRWKKNENKLER